MSVRKEIIGEAEIYLADCLDVLPTLSMVDHILTDPPFEDHMHVAKANARGLRLDGYASPKAVDFESITAIRDAVSTRMRMACNGWLIAFCTPEGIAPWRDSLEMAGCRYKRACFWIKPDSAPQFNGQGPAMAVEPFVTAWCGEGVSKWNGGGRRNFFTYPTNNPEREGSHPTEKPLSLMRELIELFTSPGDLILDPFMGSGTTGVACLQMGRRFIGIESQEHYFNLACKRLKAAYSQPRLPLEPVMKQAGLFDPEEITQPPKENAS